MGGVTPDDYNNQPGLLQRGPTSLLPPIPPPPRNGNGNGNDPTRTQVAAVPRLPPPPTPPSPQQPAPPPPTSTAAPTPGDFRPRGPVTPVPWQHQQPPPALPVPPLADWDHADEHPDTLRPLIRPQPGPLLPDRPPDAYSRGQPVYNLRPGEGGYGQGNMLSGLVAQLESGGGRFAGLQPPSIVDKTFGQKAGFIADYGVGPQGITNFARALLRANPNATFGDFYAAYTLGTGDPRHPPTLADMANRYPEAYRNLVNNASTQLGMPISDMLGSRPGGGGVLAGTPSGPQGPWTQQNLVANFAERTGQLGQPGNVPLTTVTSPNGQSWQVNTRAAAQFQGFLNDLDKAGYKGMVSSGGYSNRPIRGGAIPSEHAYGAAIDIGAEKNPLQYASAGGALRTDLPANVGEIAAKWGLKWGGTFRDRQDPMHFEVAAIMTPQQLEAARNGQVTTGAPPGTVPSGGRVTPASYRPGGGGISLNTPLSSLVGGTVAGPPQAYIPAQPREPQHWGSEPEYDWRPGRMPQSHDIPGILGALLPIAIAGALGGGGLGMIAAFAGYQNARNKGQLERAKEEKTKWKDALEENTSRLKLEMIGAKGIQAEFGGFASPQAQAALHELALRFDDYQLATAISSGDVKSVDNLLNTRDKVFQDLSKTSEAQRKADQQEDDKRAEQQPYDGQPAAPGGGETPGAAGSQPFFHEPAQEAAPAPVAAPPAVAPGSAGVPQAPAGGGGRPAPAAAPPSSEQPSPSPDEPTPQAPAAAPPAGGGQPAAAPGGAAAPGAEPGPEQLPDVEVGGLPPPDLRGPLALPNIGLSPERLDQDARQYLETQKDPYRGGTSGDPLASRRNEAVRRRASQMQTYIDHVIATTKPGNIEGALQKVDTVDPGLASIARSVDRGDQPQPTGWQLRVPLYSTVNKLVTSLDPTFSATRYITNWRTKVAYATGQQSIQVASINRALQHMTVLMDAAKHLGNTDYPSWNALVNAVKTQLGSDAATNFTAARSAVSRELERAFRGGSGAYAEIKQDLENVGTSGSPAQILGLIRTDTELLRGQLDALADLYSRGTHTSTTGDDLLSPQARHTYNRLMKMPLDRPPPETTTVNGKVVPVGPDKQEIDPSIPYPQAGPGPAPAELPPGVTVTEEP